MLTVTSGIHASMGLDLVFGSMTMRRWQNMKLFLLCTCCLTAEWSLGNMQGMVPIILSWFVSPILAFIATSILFLGVRTLVLRRKNSFNLGCIALPFLVGLTFFVITVFIAQTGKPGVSLESWFSSHVLADVTDNH